MSSEASEREADRIAWKHGDSFLCEIQIESLSTEILAALDAAEERGRVEATHTAQKAVPLPDRHREGQTSPPPT